MSAPRTLEAAAEDVLMWVWCYRIIPPRTPAECSEFRRLKRLLVRLLDSLNSTHPERALP